MNTNKNRIQKNILPQAAITKTVPSAMIQVSASKIDTFDQDDLNKTIEKAKEEALDMASLEKKPEANRSTIGAQVKNRLKILSSR